MTINVSKAKFPTAMALLSMPFVALAPLQNVYTLFVFLFCVSLMAVSRLSFRPIRPSGSLLYLMLFLFALIFSFPVAVLNGVSPTSWFMRGATPFLFFVIFYLLSFTCDARFLIRLLYYSGIVWAAKVLVTVALADYSDILRFTTVTKDLLLPFNLLGLALVLFYPVFLSKKERWLGFGVFLIMTIMAGYRSQFGIVFLMLIIFALRDLSRGRATAVVVGLTSCAAATYYFLSTEIGQFFMLRLTGQIDATADWGRIAERQFAVEKFLSSPIFGVGLGTSIPIDVTFAGREAYAFHLLERYGHDYSVSYIHNIVLYCLMSFGLVGTFAYFGLIFLSWGKVRSDSILQDRFGIIIALGALVGFNLVAATFTLLQWQVLVACLCSLASARRTTSFSEISNRELHFKLTPKFQEHTQNSPTKFEM